MLKNNLDLIGYQKTHASAPVKLPSNLVALDMILAKLIETDQITWHTADTLKLTQNFPYYRPQVSSQSLMTKPYFLAYLKVWRETQWLHQQAGLSLAGALGTAFETLSAGLHGFPDIFTPPQVSPRVLRLVQSAKTPVADLLLQSTYRQRPPIATLRGLPKSAHSLDAWQSVSRGRMTASMNRYQQAATKYEHSVTQIQLRFTS